MNATQLQDLRRQHLQFDRRGPDPHNRHPHGLAGMRQLGTRRSRRRWEAIMRIWRGEWD